MNAESKAEVFISYSRKNRRTAYRLADDLEDAKVRYWIDRERLESGDPLLDELQKVLKEIRTLALLWSRSASKSRFVRLEWQAAWYLEKKILPCPLDDTDLPPFLLPLVTCDFYHSYQKGLRQMLTALRPGSAKESGKRRTLRPGRVDLPAQDWIRRLFEQQEKVLEELIKHGPSRALLSQKQADSSMKEALRAYPRNEEILNLAGYHLKNAYLIKHWDAVRARRAQPDPLLARAEALFYESLSIRPKNPSAMNGLGSILALRRDLDAAEFYVRKAIAWAQREGFRYDAAEHDLQLILLLKQEREHRNPSKRA